VQTALSGASRRGERTGDLGSDSGGEAVRIGPRSEGLSCPRHRLRWLWLHVDSRHRIRVVQSDAPGVRGFERTPMEDISDHPPIVRLHGLATVVVSADRRHANRPEMAARPIGRRQGCQRFARPRTTVANTHRRKPVERAEADRRARSHNGAREGPVRIVCRRREPPDPRWPHIDSSVRLVMGTRKHGYRK